MDNYWELIIQQIENDFEITNQKDWKANGSHKLKLFSKALVEKLITAICTDNNIAKLYLINNETLTDFLEKSEDERILEIRRLSATESSAMEKLAIDNRTLLKWLNSKIAPDHNKVKNIFSIYKYGFTYEQFLIKCKINSSKKFKSGIYNHHKSDLKLLEFNNTFWWVYYFHYDENNRQGGIGRAFLTIKGKEDVYLQNVEDSIVSHFDGSVLIEDSKQHLYFDLQSSSTKERRFRITVFCGIGKVYPLMLGVYTNIYANNATVAGSIIFEQITNVKNEALVSEAYTYEEAERKGIDINIIEFLKSRSQNYLKSPSNILNHQKFAKWMQNP